MNYNLLPLHMREGMKNYIEHRMDPGGFLLSVLANDLKATVTQADSINLRRLDDIVEFLDWEAPGLCWGTSDMVDRWLKNRDFATLALRELNEH